MTVHGPKCLGCGVPLKRTLVDLGLSPLANSYVPRDQSDRVDPFYPLHARVCDACLLVQIESVVPPEDIFSDYAYFSSYSESWLAHCKAYAQAMTWRFDLGPKNKVIEIASNDGYMLQYFVAANIPVLGVDPAANVAKVAQARGVPTEVAFFGSQTARRPVARGEVADLLAAKNVLAHVPDINDFVEDVAILLKPDGVFTVEFPHILTLIRVSSSIRSITSTLPTFPSSRWRRFLPARGCAFLILRKFRPMAVPCACLPA